MIHILYNPLSNNRHGKKALDIISNKFSEKDMTFSDITKTDVNELISRLSPDDTIILTGGDGTLNRFVNDLNSTDLIQTIYFYPSGSGNDFIRDLDVPLENGMVCLNPYIKNLPTVTANGKSYRFINGVGYGLDGYACAECARLKEKHKLKIAYSLIALKGLLFSYKPTKATVTIDDQTFSYENVWLVPTMQGKYFGGGVMIAPMQDRNNRENTVTVGIASCKSSLKILSIYPSIYKGKHVKYTNIINFFSGQKVTVTFDRPVALQIDGEVVPDVLTYTVTTV